MLGKEFGLVWPSIARGCCSHAPAARHSFCVREKRPAGPWLQLNYLRRVNVLARANVPEQLFVRGSVEIQHRERGTARLISTE